MVIDHPSLFEIINFLPDATFVINREGKVIAWNKAIESLKQAARDLDEKIKNLQEELSG